jgi:hypothetical protein
MWWPGTELNRRRQPFQGWILPKLSVDSARHSSGNLPDLVLFIGAKMEPSCKNLSLPRFASNRDGFELATGKIEFQRTRSTTDPDHAGYRRERTITMQIERLARGGRPPKSLLSRVQAERSTYRNPYREKDRLQAEKRDPVSAIFTDRRNT